MTGIFIEGPKMLFNLLSNPRMLFEYLTWWEKSFEYLYGDIEILKHPLLQNDVAKFKKLFKYDFLFELIIFPFVAIWLILLLLKFGFKLF